MTRRVIVFDTTLRDGEQAPGNSLSVEEKVRVARQLEVLGVDVIEAGFPASSETDFRSVQEIAAQVRGPVIAALARCTERDIDLAGEAIRGAARGRIHVFLSTSDLHLKAKLRMTREEAVEKIRESVRRAKSFTEDVEWSAEDASRTGLEFLCRCVEVAISEGATTINLPDTVGYATPEEYATMFRDVRRRVPASAGIVLSAHCHDDLGLAVANSLRQSVGARQVECTINGLGERDGNAALEEIVMALKTRHDRMPYSTGLKTEIITKASRLVSTITGFPVQPNKAIVGANAFAHESGIHQDGMLKHAGTYEIMTPESVGLMRSTLVMGKHSGRHALARRFQQLGYELEDEQLGGIYQAFLELAERKRQILDEDLLALLHESFHDAPEEFQLRSLRVVCGSGVATADVTLGGAYPGERRATGSGDGPNAAAFAAVSEIVGKTIEVESLSLRSVTPGRDSVGQVFLQVRVDGRTFSAHSASTDIVEASARAMINALNKSRHAESLEAAALDSNSYWSV
jgi:2-isopropylmalate synthase